MRPPISVASRSRRRRRGALVACLLLVAAAPVAGGGMPWREAGLTERQAAAHLLNRFTFGPRPEDVDRVVAQGLEAWFAVQLQGSAAEPHLASRLEPLTSLALSTQDYTRRFRALTMVIAEAIESGVLRPDVSVQALAAGPERDVAREALFEFARARGYRSEKELVGELRAQKLLRAVYAENQLQEVLTDFWFNHFNVSISDSLARPFVLAYEREAIRPRVAGPFRDLLGATARHPAMLFFLDNAQSTAAADEMTTMETRLEERFVERRLGGRGGGRDADGRARYERRMARRRESRNQGLNENYARELLELHTLGVDGGFSQRDIIQVARAFSGWTALPPVADLDAVERRIEKARDADVGFVFEEGFVFRADAHDAGVKVVLGHRLRSGRGIEDGEEVLDLLAAHPATAEHLARKLAVRFLSDDPPASVVTRLSAAYRAAGGDLAAVLSALVESPEFWAAEALGAKIKSPFEVATSALRALAADLYHPGETLDWIERMGQPLYDYEAPTGFPDQADYWVSAGGLLNRMNFGLHLASSAVAGVVVDLAALLGGVEPESRIAALDAFLGLLLPERDLGEAATLLAPMVEASDLAARLEAAGTDEAKDPGLEQADPLAETVAPPAARRRRAAPSPPDALAQVVGVILGSPEFQRR